MALGAGNHIPALFAAHAKVERVVVVCFHTQHAAFPVAEEDFPQIRIHDRSEAEVTA